MRGGSLDPERVAPIGYAHIATVEECRPLLEEQLDEEALVETEAFTTVGQTKRNGLSPGEREAWLDPAERAGAMFQGLGDSYHSLLVGTKREA